MMTFTECYSTAAYLLPRLLGAIYCCAFGAFLFQIRGLICSNGILPLGEYLTAIKRIYPRRYFRIAPTLLWFNHSDQAIIALVATGTFLSVLLMFGFIPTLLLCLLYILYLSVISAGQDFLSFGWEGFLLEITLNTVLLSLSSPPNLLVWISINFVLFRFHFEAGISKLESNDPNWRNLTAIAYHYLTQPLPNTTAWYVHKWPLWFHKASTAYMFLVEIGVPFLILGPEWMRLIAFIGLVSLQWGIWVTGNLSFLNHLTTVLCVILLSNSYIPWIQPPPPSNPGWTIEIVSSVIAAILIALQLIQFSTHYFRTTYFARILEIIWPFHIANRYGIFAVMTTNRIEIVVEGSNDGIEWKEYTFLHKPSDISKRPRRISPYQPRLDWQAWFLPLGSRYRHEHWLNNFLIRLLQGTPEVLSLIDHNPFADHPPVYIRTLAYDYTFSSYEEKKEHGYWWKRRYVGLFTAPIKLASST